MVMRAGRMRSQIELQSSDTTQDRYGGRKQSWTTYDTVWAEIVPLRGGEALQANQVEARISHLVRIRNNENVSPRHRILFGSRILKINSVLRIDERGFEMELICEETAEE